MTPACNSAEELVGRTKMAIILVALCLSGCVTTDVIAAVLLPRENPTRAT